MELRNIGFFLVLLTLPYSSGSAEQWQLGGDLTLQFQSDVPFEFGQKEAVMFGAHLPGFGIPHKGDSKSLLLIEHHYSSSDSQLIQVPGQVILSSSWKQNIPPDFIHLVYGAARLEWLRHGIFAVHAACIGNETEGYTLLMGNPGSGKTTLTLESVLKHGYKVFSGDKTLLKFNENHELMAVAGTQTITIRSEDANRWIDVPKMNEYQIVDRLAFQLQPDYHANEQQVPIKRILFVGLNDAVNTAFQLSPRGALHALYPFFLDKQREDVLVEGELALLDGAVDKEVRKTLVKDLKTALDGIPVYKAIGSLENVSSFIAGKPQLQLTKGPKKILFGICGIGNGHCSRQLPILRHFLDQGHQVMVFTYGEGLTFFSARFPQHPNLTIIPVADPYYVGNAKGLDYELTATSEKNTSNFTMINSMAMHRATTTFGRPDLVISDYEMVAAQYAYAKHAPLVTLDQQSKYLVGNFTSVLNNTSCLDEVERLSLFFPKADKRIAVSFFRVVDRNKRADFDVEVYPPMIRPDVIQAKGHPLAEKPSILVYVTAQQLGDQPIDQWIGTIRSTLPEDYTAHIFLPQRLELSKNDPNLCFYHHGDKRFDSLLFSSHGIITTAGHNLLTEAMYLEKPVYALPLPIYEQQINAQVIAQGGFGVSSATLTEDSLREFFTHLNEYAQNIRDDKKYLFKEIANDLIIHQLEMMFLSND